ncbi:MAG: hypothetical protein AAF799_43970 [Myxococcota bacterium]
MTSALELRDGFRFRVPLDADALWDRLSEHPRIRVAEDPAPDPPPPEGAPFLIARQSAREFRLRHWAGPADAASPVVIMKLEPDGHGGTLVRGHFENRNRQRRLVDLPRLRRGGGAFIAASVVVTVLAIALLAPVLIGAPLDTVVSVLGLLFFFTVPTALVFVPGLIIWNAEGRKRFIAPLWELVGEVMLPIALPESTSDRPFRGHALPAAGD